MRTRFILFLFLVLWASVGFTQSSITPAQETIPEEPKENNEEVIVIVEKMPEFPGGEEAMMTFLVENIKYPKEAIDKGIEGKVYISFVVTSEASISNVELRRGVHKLLDDEAIRVVKMMPKWIPGTQGGRKVNVQFNIPLDFKLEKSGVPDKSDTKKRRR